MMNAEGLFIGAGGVTLAASFKQAGGFPANGYTVVAATVALVFLASTVRGSRLEPPAKAAAGLMLLVAIYRYIPAFYNERKPKNG